MSEYIYVPVEARKAARRANLYNFLLRHHYNDVKKEGNSLRLLDNNSVSIKEGYSGYFDFSTKEKGNSIKFLMEFLDYSFPDAVIALCADMGIDAVNLPEFGDATEKAPSPPRDAKKGQDTVNRTFAPPEPLQGQYRQLYAYLTQHRGIPPALIQRLIDDKLLYQAADHGNMVFIDPARTFMEIRGSNSFKPFHQVAFSDPAAFWWFKPRGLDTDPTVAYICEGAIDAISLYLLLSLDTSTNADRGLYCSIGGVANQQRIDAIKTGMDQAGCPTIITVDNDKAGEGCRQHNQDCKCLIPTGKDWNEDLISWERSTAGAVSILEKAIAGHRNRG